MCKFFSCIVMKDKKVFWESGLDGHHEILEKFGIPDNPGEPPDSDKMKFARVEILPPSGVGGVFEKDLEKWFFCIDERVRPEWFSPAHKLAAIEALRLCLAQCVFDGNLSLDPIKVSGGSNIFVRNAKVTAYGPATVTAYGSATVTAYGSATVTAYGSATVTAHGSATVTAYGSATVTAHGPATVTAYGSATVTAYDSVTVTAYGSATVTAYGSATVTAYDSVTVTAYDSVTVLVGDVRAEIELMSKMAAAVCRFGEELTFKRKE